MTTIEKAVFDLELLEGATFDGSTAELKKVVEAFKVLTKHVVIDTLWSRKDGEFVKHYYIASDELVLTDEEKEKLEGLVKA